MALSYEHRKQLGFDVKKLRPKDKKVFVYTIVEKLRPEAKKVVNMMMNEPKKTTKDNYIKVVSILSEFNDDRMSLFFLMAMEREGYPKTTCARLRRMMGW